MIGIYVIELVGQQRTGNAFHEGWVREYDPDAFDGGGTVRITHDPAHALRFASLGDAFEFYRKPSTVRPYRSDGLPNRPLTAYTVEFRPLPNIEPMAPDHITDRTHWDEKP